MLFSVLQVVALVVAGPMVGNELCVGLFLHPTLRHLPDDLHAPTRRAFAALFGRIMPFWYIATLLLSVAVTWMGPSFSSVSGKLFLGSSLLWLLAIVFTVIFPAPLNSRIAAWQLESLPQTWRSDAQRWDGWHAIRMVMLVSALVCLTAGTVVSHG